MVGIEQNATEQFVKRNLDPSLRALHSGSELLSEALGAILNLQT